MEAREKIELSSEQIQSLFKFVEKKYVRYKDVQYELVDHLASAIEVLLEKDKNLTFEQALRKVYGQFPVTGFHQFVSARQESIRKYYNRNLFMYMLQYMKLPKILISVFLFVLVFQLLNIFGKQVLYIGYIVICAAWFIALLKSDFIKELRKLKDEQYLILNYYRNFIFGFGIFYWYMPTIGFDSSVIGTVVLLPLMSKIIIALFFTFGALFIHASLVYFPALLKEEIRTKYAHLNLKFS